MAGLHVEAKSLLIKMSEMNDFFSNKQKRLLISLVDVTKISTMAYYFPYSLEAA